MPEVSRKQRSREIRVHYPVVNGRIGLRTDLDWDRTIEAVESSDDGHCYVFHVRPGKPYFYFKPVLIDTNGLHWSQGDNYLALEDGTSPREIYPHFFDTGGCHVAEPRELAIDGGTCRYRVFQPPGYEENTLKRYPILYMQDGQNLFFPDEAFAGVHWQVPETLGVLDSMNIIDKVLVVGLYPNEREHDYTSPGYEAYGRFFVERLKPEIDLRYRTLHHPRHTAVMGSSLGGVVSLYLSWQYPEIFGMAGCMSSTFGWRDDLFERIANEPRRDIRLYLDSGWPQDNYEVTCNMRALLARRGYVEGGELLYFAFPQALHNERFWAMRSHLPYQFFFGRRHTPS